MAANQGSRAGLITTVVILSIASVVAIIFAFWYAAEKRKADQDYADLKKRYSDIIADASLNGPEVTELKALRSSPDGGFTPQTKLWDIAMAQRNQLVRLVTGADVSAENSPAAAAKKGTTALESANAVAKVPSTVDSMVRAVDVLASKVKEQTETIVDRDRRIEEANDGVKRANDQAAEARAAWEKKVAEIQANWEQANKDLEAARARNEGVVADIRKAGEDKEMTQREALSKRELDIADREAQIKQLKDQLTRTQARFDRIRVGVTDPMIRHADGQVSGFGGKDIIYIDLGQGRHMVPGMTFEVYDKNRGVPKMDDPLAQEQPLGKASIEVIRVLETGSECRVIRTQPGQQIMEGDPILNVVYDPNVQYGIVVYGKFDLDRNGVATENDTAVVRRMVSEWGGKLLDVKDQSGKIRVSVDTDFLVIGAEPVIPEFSAEEMTDPINVRKQETAKAELAAYEDVVNQARDLHIPILNQNRFLAFTGQQAAVTR